MSEKIAIVTPVYNAEKTIKTVTECIKKQTYPHWNLFIYDDGSKDDTQNLTSTFIDPAKTVIYHSPQNNGVSYARNSLLRHIRHLNLYDYIAYCDADDFWQPSHLEESLRALRNQNADVVYSDCYFVDSKGTLCTSFGIKNPTAFDPLLLDQENFIYISSVVHRIHCLSIGQFDSTLDSLEEWDYWKRMSHAGYKFYHLNKQLTIYTVNPEGMASKATPSQRATIQNKFKDRHIYFNSIKLNLACGKSTKPDFINVDLYEPEADFNYNVDSLPYRNDSVSLIYASHIIEHFHQHKIYEILKEWHRVLKPGGQLIIETPDFYTTCKEFIATIDENLK